MKAVLEQISSNFWKRIFIRDGTRYTGLKKIPAGEKGEQRLYWTVVNRDSHGKIIEKKIVRAHSFVANYYAYLVALFGNQNYGLVIKDTAGTAHNGVSPFGTAGSDFIFMRISGFDDYGIQVGTGVTAPTVNDYKLTTKITTGVGAGQLSYGGMSASGDVTVNAGAGTTQMSYSRTFTNSSGASITIQEVGIVGRDQTNTFNFLISHDLLTINIANGGNSTITATFTTTT